MENYTQLVSDFLIESFVDDYDFTRDYVDHLNIELQSMDIPYTYSYDEFCVELLERFKCTIDRICTSRRSWIDLRDKFGDLVFRTVKEMKMEKLSIASEPYN